MTEVHVSIRFVDGGLQDYQKGPDFLSKLRLLQSQGVAGRQLVHELISDEFGAPPSGVEVWGQDAGGQGFSIKIPYS
jgi:hypothetical protein